MRLKRFVILSLLSGIITILCHANADAPDNRRALSLLSGELVKPSTEDDSGNTMEETPLTINVLQNDRSDRNDDDDGDEIDPATVDLDPHTDPINSTISTAQGSYVVNAVGEVTYSPSLNFVGLASAEYSVNDKRGRRSNRARIRITVTNVDDPPVITGQNPNPVTTMEEQSVAIGLNNLMVTDSDDAYPANFTLNILPGSNYSVSGTTVTPSPDFEGTLSVGVTVNDGEANSNVFNLQVQVTGINDAPVITTQNPNPLTTGEEQAVTILLTHLVVTDRDDVFPTDFTLTVSEGANYTLSGNTVTPAANFSGTLSVPVLVNDGALNSNTFNLQISVTSQNDPPVITGHAPLVMGEDNSLRVALTDLTVTDNDNTYPTDFTLILSPGSNYTLSGTTVIPSPDYAGPLTVPAVVNDGTNDSAPFNLSITVNPVNDIPIITGQAALSTGENQSIEISLGQLVVTDPDNSYPSGFALSILAGSNYSVSGTTVTPAPGFNGTLTVGVFVNDGQASSAVFNLQITVNAINNPPVITGQNPLSVAEDNSLTVQLSDLMVTDPDNTYPNGFSVFVQPGSNYTVSGTTVIPVLNFTGSLTVGVYVNDGISNSALFDLSISVTAVNDAPLITGQQPLNTNEDQPINIELAQLVVSDPDNSYPAGFSLSVSSGVNYTVAGNTVAPDPDFKGVLNIPVQVNDGLLNSNIFNLSVTVNDLNDTPVITGQVPLSTPEDTPVTITLSHLTVLDADDNYPAGFTLAVASGTNYTVSGNTITPALDFTGTLNIGVTVNDGESNSAPFIFQIQVGDSNDPPVITGQVLLSTNEEQSITILLSHLTVTDPDNPYPTGFTLLVSPGNDYSLSGNTIIPALNFVGTLTVPVRVNDGVNNSATFDLKLEVNQINDAPGFSAIANVKVPENSPPGKIIINNISKGPDEEAQQLTFVVTSGNTDIIPHPVINYNGTAASAELTYSVVANKSGIVTITVVAIDNGSNVPPHTNSYSATFQIEVSEINLAPTLDAIANITMQEDASLQALTLTGITSGAGESQVLSVEASTSNPELFEILQVSYSSASTTGTLQLKPQLNSFGTAQVTVKVTDNGSAISPSVNFVMRTFTVTVQPVNDPPVFVSVPVNVAAVNELYNYDITVSDVENATLSITASEKPAWATLTNTGPGKARLSGTPPASATGSVLVRIIVKDGEVIAEQQYTLIVNTRPTVTSFDISTREDVPVTFQPVQFTNVYRDVNQHGLSYIQITAMPVSGTLFVSDREVKPNDTIITASLGSLAYKPDQNYSGEDTFQWKASDGYHFSAVAASVSITMIPVNDAPVITLETDSLKYEVNGEAIALTSILEISDPDDDTLSQAQLIFRKQNFAPEYDLLIFHNTPNIKGFFDFQSGILSLTGNAPLKEYQQAIRDIQYNHLNTLDPKLELKTISIAVHDGELFSDAKDRWIALQYTFIELDIPTGFTPNGDNANDRWIISRPGGIEKLQEAVVRVFNRRGVMVYQARGFDKPWDGTMDGELLPADTYYFTIDLKLRSRKTYKGIVTILR